VIRGWSLAVAREALLDIFVVLDGLQENHGLAGLELVIGRKTIPIGEGDGEYVSDSTRVNFELQIGQEFPLFLERVLRVLKDLEVLSTVGLLLGFDGLEHAILDPDHRLLIAKQRVVSWSTVIRGVVIDAVIARARARIPGVIIEVD
jgi:hypothetical protein